MGKKKNQWSKLFREYLEKGIQLKRYQKVGILFLLVVFAGFFGWVYEFILYFFDGGMKEFYMQGGNLLPWINIYAIGAVLVVATTFKLRRNPWLVFIVATLVTGILEFVAGWLVYTVGNGTRYWDYNIEIWNFGNIGGFVCLRSVLFFGVSALFLMYMIIPSLVYLALNLSKRKFLTLAITIFVLVMLDEVVNLTLKNLDLPTAMDFYESLGLKYKY
ncbi:putative ABC transporter permease [Candidatus Saccharibacteria bacterium]|nr:putative ABC transporter permease [Candidatus Saccharibacteria bacterium]